MRPIIFLALILALAFGAYSCKKPEQFTRSISDKLLPQDAYTADISIKEAETSIPRNITIEMILKVKNAGGSPWPSGLSRVIEPYTVYLTYKWLNKNGTPYKRFDENGNEIFINTLITLLPYDIMPNKTVLLKARVATPFDPGDYKLEFYLAQRGVGRFNLKTPETAMINMTIW